MHIRRGLLVMLSSTLFFSAMAVCIRLLHRTSPQISPHTVSLVRFFVGNLVVLGAFAAGISRVQWVNWRWIVIRGVTGGLGIMTHYWAITELGLAKAGVYAYSSPIFAAVMAIPILGERPRLDHWGAISGAFAGMALVMGVVEFNLSWKDLIGLSAGVLWGAAIVSLTKCRATDDSINIFWSQCLFGIAFALWPSARAWVWPTGGEAAMLLLIAAFSIIGQIAMTSAYKYTGATYGSLLGLLTLILNVLAGVAAFQEPLSRYFWVGAPLILVSCIYLTVRPIRRGSAPGEGGAPLDVD